ncbi:MAG: copper chaperone PCu(A)C [Pseudomonadota bacterium]
MFRLFSSVALAGLVVACAPAETSSSGTETSVPVLSYSDAFVMQPIAGRDITMGGLTLSTDGGDVTLTSASSPSIDTIELHTMSMTDGKMQMRQVEGFEIADGESLELKRGGNHLMLFGVGEGVVAGETIDITLNLEADGAPMTLVVEADVRAVGE